MPLKSITAPPQKTADRQQTIDLLRLMLDALEADESLTTPYDFGFGAWSAVKFYPDSLDEVRALVKAFGGRWDKNDPNKSEYDQQYATFKANLNGLKVSIIIARNKTCEMVQVGTKTVKQEVVKVPAVSVVEDVEVPDYQFKCEPLFSREDIEKIGN